MKYIGAALFVFCVSTMTFADTQYCDDLYISDVWVEGSRDDAHVLQNKLIVKVENENGIYSCGGKSYLHLENTSPAYNGMLSVALSALAANKKVEIAINTDNATTYSYQLAFIRIKR